MLFFFHLLALLFSPSHTRNRTTTPSRPQVWAWLLVCGRAHKPCEGTRLLAITHRLAVRCTCGPGTGWYDIPASDLSSHDMFVLLYLQTVHRNDLPGKESVAKAWIIASVPGASWSSPRRGRAARGRRVRSRPSRQRRRTIKSVPVKVLKSTLSLRMFLDHSVMIYLVRLGMSSKHLFYRVGF